MGNTKNAPTPPSFNENEEMRFFAAVDQTQIAVKGRASRAQSLGIDGKITRGHGISNRFLSTCNASRPLKRCLLSKNLFLLVLGIESKYSQTNQSKQIYFVENKQS